MTHPKLEELAAEMVRLRKVQRRERERVTAYGTALHKITETDVGRGERMKQIARAVLNSERGPEHWNDSERGE